MNDDIRLIVQAVVIPIKFFIVEDFRETNISYQLVLSNLIR